MTSRQYSDRTARTDSGTRRPTNRRGIKKRGILPSFGDIVLPVVSVAAVGLLILAGRQFFMNGLNTSPDISSTRAYAEAPALIAEREKKQENEESNAPVAAKKTESVDIAVAAPKTEFLKTAEVVTPPKPKIATATTNTTNTNASAPAKVNNAPAKNTAPAKTNTTAKATATKTPAKAPAAKLTVSSISKQWRVQVGAYGSKSAAQIEVDKINKAGFQAIVYSNPASKHVKVWVAGGNDKQSAEKVLQAMKKMGYKSSFSFPPAK